MENLVGEPVQHKKFGAGKIAELKNTILTIHFAQYGTRSFRFPDAFLNGDLKSASSALMHALEQLHTDETSR